VTNFDPGGLLLLLTVIPSAVAGVVSVGVAHLAARLGYGEYDSNVAIVLGVLAAAWVVASLLVSTEMVQILAVGLAMVGAFAVTRSVTWLPTAGWSASSCCSRSTTGASWCSVPSAAVHAVRKR
jgi:hypothetical protein